LDLRNQIPLFFHLCGSFSKVVTGKIKTEVTTEIKKMCAVVSADKSQTIKYYHKPIEISVLQKHNLAYGKKAHPNTV